MSDAVPLEPGWFPDVFEHSGPDLPPAPIQELEEGGSLLTLEEPAPGVREDFWAACLRSGLDELICQKCAQVWLSRNSSPLCPVCNPEHPGYEPNPGPEFYARSRRYWQDELLGLLRRRERVLWQDGFRRLHEQIAAVQFRPNRPPIIPPELVPLYESLGLI